MGFVSNLYKLAYKSYGHFSTDMQNYVRKLNRLYLIPKLVEPPFEKSFISVALA